MRQGQASNPGHTVGGPGSSLPRPGAPCGRLAPPSAHLQGFRASPRPRWGTLFSGASYRQVPTTGPHRVTLARRSESAPAAHLSSVGRGSTWARPEFALRRSR
ncbi:hypothetical protein NDU88_005379 [Pleurodeles waltl]|uniref:Uncharacterized protein n=1 Tax=Pleurodeles waltl TaxID=8319 RepID=A0AAV7NNW0_PLEWA|nr:hypothetical protein NDU88_005379 [Pleurodeles waltl]